MANSGRIRIAVVEGDARWRSHLAALLASPGGCSCVGPYASVDKAIQHLAFERPDVVVLGWDRSESEMTESILRLKASDGRLGIIGFCQDADYGLLSSLLAAGADAVVSKADPPLKLIEAIDCVRQAARSSAVPSPVSWWIGSGGRNGCAAIWTDFRNANWMSSNSWPRGAPTRQ